MKERPKTLLSIESMVRHLETPRFAVVSTQKDGYILMITDDVVVARLLCLSMCHHYSIITSTSYMHAPHIVSNISLRQLIPKMRHLNFLSVVRKSEAAERLTLPTLAHRHLIPSREQIRITRINRALAEFKLLICNETPVSHSHTAIELRSAIVLYIIRETVQPRAVSRTSEACEPAEPNA